MKYNGERINKFKRAAISSLARNTKLRDLCDQVWIFGSTVDGCSSKPCTPFSDTDIAVFFNGDIDGHEGKEIHNIISRTLQDELPTSSSRFDLIWLNNARLEKERALVANVYKGERII